MKNQYIKLIKFKYKESFYQMFIDKKNKIAFLELDQDGNYRYPTLEAWVELVQIFGNSTNVLSIKKHQNKTYSFVPKLKYAGLLLTITTSLLSVCMPKVDKSILPNTNIAIQQSTDKTTIDNEFLADATFIRQDDASFSNYNAELLAPADDEYDFQYASDYETLYPLKYVYLRDASAYEQVLGYSNVTETQIKKALNKNWLMPLKYKKFILQYVQDWTLKYPGTDFSILYTNLPTLKIKEISRNDMMIETLSTDSVACYKRSQNTLYVLKGISLEKESEDYIILIHELSHCARGTDYINKKGERVQVSFYDDMSMGYYAEEALITNFAYEMQGLGEKSHFYTLQSSYFRIILNAIDYDGADFMNHSVNYLIDKMDEFMNDEQYAHYIIALIDAEANSRYAEHLSIDLKEFDDLYVYMLQMYMKKNLNPQSTYAEAMNIYDNFIAEITYYFDKMKEPYYIDYSVFETEFQNILKDYNITKGLNK